MKAYIGVDVGSLTTKLVALDEYGDAFFTKYIRNRGGPIEAVQQGFRELEKEQKEDMNICGVGTTGSGRHLASIMAGADIIKNEITAHAVAASHVSPEARTVIDIGGQDSKIIHLKDGVAVGFNMNTVCAAGTGSFLDHQSERLGIPIEEFGEYALQSNNAVRISGRCGVFAESDLIHKQQMGYKREDLIAGLCMALARNYVTNVARSKKLEPVVLFQGGVAANRGIKRSLESLLDLELLVPENFKVMGAYGAALLARREKQGAEEQSNYRGAHMISNFDCYPNSFICEDCSNSCEINELYINDELVSRWGSRCAKWEDLHYRSPNSNEEKTLF